MQALVIDLGGSHFTCAAVRGELILAKSEAKINSENFHALLPVLKSHLTQLANAVRQPLSAFAGILLGFPGIVDCRNARVIATNGKFSDAPSLDLCAWASNELGLRLFLENDARLALLGEHALGGARGIEDCVLVALGTGIGAAAMVEGRLLRGMFGYAGCLGGHIPVVLGGRQCTCGNLGCAEAEASTWALTGICGDQPGFSQSLLFDGQIDFKSLFEAADRGDIVACKVVSRCVHVWSALTVALIHAYSPQVVLFGGAVMARADAILPAIRLYVSQHSWAPSVPVEIKSATLGPLAALHGTVPFLKEAGG